MNNDTEPRLTTESDARLARIYELMPGLMVQQRRLEVAGLRAAAVVLPAHLNPREDDGDDAAGAPAFLMGMPVIWGEPAGLVVCVLA